MKDFKIIINTFDLMKLYPNGKPSWIKDRHELLQHSINSNKLDISDDLLTNALIHLKTIKAITVEQFDRYYDRILKNDRSSVIKSHHVKSLIALRPPRKRIKMLIC